MTTTTNEKQGAHFVEIEVPLPTTLYARLAAAAKREGVTPSEFVSVAINESMQRVSKGK